MYSSGKKLPEYPSQEEEVLLLEERVSEAKRLATTVKFCIKMLYLDYFVCLFLLRSLLNQRERFCWRLP